MFDSWSLDNGLPGVGFSKAEILYFIDKILKRENLNPSEKDKEMLYMFVSMSCTDSDNSRKMRELTGFDSKALGFCRSIDLAEKFYKK